MMKKNFLKTILVAVFCLVTGYVTYSTLNKNKTLSELVLANVEALARYELPEVGITCSGGTQGACFVSSNSQCFLDYMGFFRDYWCEFTGYMEYSCTTLCN